MYFKEDRLTDLCVRIFLDCGMSETAAKQTARVLIAADARGIPSHGIARLPRYVHGLKGGFINFRPQVKILQNTPVSLNLDADGSMGAPVSCDVMSKIIVKAEKSGMALGTVRNSTHFGIAGFYAMMALEHDMIGFAATNTAPRGLPTFGGEARFGTNPLAVAVPAGRHPGFVLDMATTAVTQGKVELHSRLNKPLPDGWAVNRDGTSATDAAGTLRGFLTGNCFQLPLGGDGEVSGGHKGYGLAVLVDILCAVLSGGDFGRRVRIPTGDVSARVSHMFGAVKISSFRDPVGFKTDMDALLDDLRRTPAARGQFRVWYAGEKEAEAESRAKLSGIPLDEPTCGLLRQIAADFHLEQELQNCILQ